MKNARKFLALFFVLVLTLSLGLGAVNASAQELELSEEELAALLEGADISASDVSASDTVSFASLADSTVSEVKCEAYGISAMLPTGGMTITTESTAEEMAAIGATLEDLVDGGQLIYTYSADEGHLAMVCFDSTEYTKMVGNYKNLSTAQLEAVISTTVSYGEENGMDYEEVKFVDINGNRFLKTAVPFEYEGVPFMYYTLETIVDGTRFTFEYQIANDMTEEDMAVLEDMFRSIKVKGASAALSALEIVLIAVCAVMFVVLAFVVFFLVRFSAFSKASGSKFNIFGFNFPEKK